MGTFSQMATQLQSIVPDPSMVGPMLTAAVTGMAGNYASSKLGKLNPMEKIEQVVTKKLDNSRAGRWVNRKIDQASDYMDRKLGNTTEITPELRSAIGSEVTTQLNARGVGTSASSASPAGGSSGSRSTPPTPPSPPPSSTGGSGGASGGGRR